MDIANIRASSKIANTLYFFIFLFLLSLLSACKTVYEPVIKVFGKKFYVKIK